MAQLSRFHRVHKFENGVTLIYYKHNVNNTTQYLVGYLGGGIAGPYSRHCAFCGAYACDGF